MQSGQKSRPDPTARNSSINPLCRFMSATLNLRSRNDAIVKRKESKSRRSRVAANLGLIKLDRAARRLGCHIETLRLRIRSGKLKAYRGQHGAYYIRVDALLRLLANKPPAPPPPKQNDLELAWRRARLRAREQLAIEEEEDAPAYEVRRFLRRVRRMSDAGRREPPPRQELQTLVAFLEVLKKNPDLHAGAFRILLSQGLSSLEFRPNQIAAVLGISERHVRRLARIKDIGGPVYRAASRWGRRRARQLVAELRKQLAGEGLRYHRSSGKRGTPVHPSRPRPAFIVTELTYDEVMGLGRAGLSDEQIWAITVVGIGSDELNQLLLRGTR